MMLGNVNSHREAIIQFAVLGEDNQRQGIKAVIDTGYTGFLTLPSTIITTLELTWIYAKRRNFGRWQHLYV
jgi:predicted aspartyl protease